MEIPISAKHEPIEYYRGWDGYSHPISLDHKITKEEADALHAEGPSRRTGHPSRDQTGK